MSTSLAPVLTCESKLALKAYDFELSPASNVRLPNRILHMSAYRDKVGLITHAKEALVWHIGGALKQLDTSKVQETVAEFDHWATYGVLFHPVSKKGTLKSRICSLPPFIFYESSAISLGEILTLS